MRKLLIAIVLIVLLVTVGWLSFSYDGNRASVSLETAEMREDTEEALATGEAAIENAREHGKELLEENAER